MWDALRSLTVGDTAGEQHRFVHTWPWPHGATVLLLIVAIVTVLAIYARERTSWRLSTRMLIGMLRCICIFIVIVVMMYGWNVVKDITELPDLIVAVDESGSMLHQDPLSDKQILQILKRSGFSEPNRWNIARAMLVDPKQPLLERLSKRYRLKLYRIASSVRANIDATSSPVAQVNKWSIQPDASQHRASRLGAGLRSILDAQRGRPTAAIIVLSDGITTDGESISDTAPYAKQLNIPLYLVAIGDERPVRDLRIADLLSDDVVFVGDLAHFDFRLSADGYRGEEVTLRLMNADTQQVLAERTIKIEQHNSAQTARLSFRPEHVGEIDVRVEATAATADINAENNQLTRTINVRDDMIRVLLVQEYPSFEYRTLKALLERGTQRGTDEQRKAIDLHVVLQEADLEYANIDASAKRAFPVDRTELFQYDVLILGDANPAFFSDSLLDNISDFVTERGGGLILLSGPRHMPWAYRGTPIAELFPVMPDRLERPDEQTLFDEGFTITPTAQGHASPLIQLTDDASTSAKQWLRFPQLHWVATADELRLGAHLLLEAEKDQQRHPLLCMQFVGAGKVLMLLTDETYRWGRHPEGEAYYARFWLQTLRYLSRTKLLGGNRLVEFTADKESYERGEPVRLKARFLDDRLAPANDDGVAVMLEQEGGRRRTISMIRDGAHRGIFQTEILDLPEGEYRAWIAAPPLEGEPPSLHFPVVAERGELARLEVDAADLRLAAEQSQGKFYNLQTYKALFKDLPQGRQVRVQTLPPRPLWNAPLWPVLFIALITAEWLLRKRAGML